VKYVIGVLIILAGIALGLYVGVWVFLIGGVANIVDGAKADPTNARQIAWGVAEVFVLASLCGTLIAYAFGFVGYLCFGAEKPRRYNAGGSARQVERNWERISRG